MSKKENYNYTEMLFSKKSKEDVIEALTSKCEDYKVLYDNYEKLSVKYDQLVSLYADLIKIEKRFSEILGDKE